MKVVSKGTYYGSQNFLKSYDGILLSHYDYTGERTEWHYHENPYFMYVTRGNMIDGNSYQKTLCPTGSLMYNNWQEEHYGSKKSNEASGFHLEFDRGWLAKHDFSTDILEGSHLIEHPQVHLLFAQLYYEFSLDDRHSTVSIESILIQICDALSNTAGNSLNREPAWINGLKDLLHSDHDNHSLSYLSDQLAVHPVHISRAAPKYLNMGIGAYIRLQKLKKAMPLLWHSDLSLTQITFDAGFSDQSHFNRVFKSCFNINPSQFRKRLKISEC